VAGEPAGWLGVYEENEPDYRHASLDITLMPAFCDMGLGPEALRTVIDWLVAERGHHRFTIDPAALNARAIAAYEKVGFERVGILRKYERGHDGSWHDGLLMDLVVEPH
jgi:aminoglycoside 6'-N-acetyltransferase